MNYDLKLKGFVGAWDFDSDYVDYILEKYKDRGVTVVIDSTGGSVFKALSISAAFKMHGDVHVHFVGANASAATIASLGAKKITMDEQALYMVHCCSALVFEFQNMNAEQIDAKCKELQSLKKDLETLDISVAAAYAKRCKKSPEELHDLMKKDNWITAQQALEWGFVDELTDLPEDPAPVLDVVTACAFEKAGIPMPDIPVNKADFPAAGNVLKKFINYFKHKPDNKTVMNPENNTVEHPQTEEQKPDPEGKVTQPEPEADAEEKRTEDPDKDFADFKAQKEKEIADLKAEIAALKKQPADEHKNVVDEKKDKHDETGKSDFFATVRSANKLFKSLP